ncbi:hypothetical protein Pcinc_041246 [Petrolisthes cinctipes]|uniref:Uncharacterized protein n=1 Tax=Petrolisthes cinctipes TaxID=88211 RepID=A0AAE1BN17_PETCI|nr:hypothetical protein Pcinc_041246 [Petrolisthes cinctipes]
MIEEELSMNEKRSQDESPLEDTKRGLSCGRESSVLQSETQTQSHEKYTQSSKASTGLKETCKTTTLTQEGETKIPAAANQTPKDLSIQPVTKLTHLNPSQSPQSSPSSQPHHSQNINPSSSQIRFLIPKIPGAPLLPAFPPAPSVSAPSQNVNPSSSNIRFSIPKLKIPEGSVLPVSPSAPQQSQSLNPSSSNIRFSIPKLRTPEGFVLPASPSAPSVPQQSQNLSPSSSNLNFSIPKLKIPEGFVLPASPSIPQQNQNLSPSSSNISFSIPKLRTPEGSVLPASPSIKSQSLNPLSSNINFSIPKLKIPSASHLAASPSASQQSQSLNPSSSNIHFSIPKLKIPAGAVPSASPSGVSRSDTGSDVSLGQHMVLPPEAVSGRGSGVISTGPLLSSLNTHKLSLSSSLTGSGGINVPKLKFSQNMNSLNSMASDFNTKLRVENEEGAFNAPLMPSVETEGKDKLKQQTLDSTTTDPPPPFTLDHQFPSSSVTCDDDLDSVVLRIVGEDSGLDIDLQADPLTNSKPSLQTQESPSHTTDNSPHMPETLPQIHENVPDIHENLPQIHENLPQIHENQPQIHENLPQIHENLPQIHENPPLLTLDRSNGLLHSVSEDFGDIELDPLVVVHEKKQGPSCFVSMPPPPHLVAPPKSSRKRPLEMIIEVPFKVFRFDTPSPDERVEQLLKDAPYLLRYKLLSQNRCRRRHAGGGVDDKIDAGGGVDDKIDAGGGVDDKIDGAGGVDDKTDAGGGVDDKINTGGGVDDKIDRYRRR